MGGRRERSRVAPSHGHRIVPLLLTLLVAAVGARAQTETVLYSFAGPVSGGTGADGANPYGGLLRDSTGNLFGTTINGGVSALGAVFELTPTGTGTYTEKVLYSFAGPIAGGTGADGAEPVAGLIMDSSGNLYGTTATGGAFGYGTVFELAKASGYTETVLYSFGATSADGRTPDGALAMDSSGNLYGTTQLGGAASPAYGTVFELVKSLTSAGYSEKILYSFGTAGNSDAAYPYAGPVLDAACDVYGTTTTGGASTAGTVYELVNSSGSCTSPGTYSVTILHSFSNTTGDGYHPYAALLMDSTGDLFGTTEAGGTPNAGTVFELVNSSGSYTEKILYSFTGNLSPFTDGSDPQSNLIEDSFGDLYGTTEGGGVNAEGTIFELVNSATSPGTYTEKVLYSFGNTSTDGFQPYYSGVVADSSGKLYGTTEGGGTVGYGTVYELNPTGTAAAVTLSASSLALTSTLGAPSSPQTVTVTNSGSANLTFATGAVTISGTNSADFAVSSDACSGSTVIPSNTCSVSVTFTPSLVGTETATLNFADNAAGSPQTVSLTGTGASAAVGSLSPASLTFGAQLIGTTSAAQTVTLSNSGSGALGSISISTDNSAFAETNNCPSSLATGGSCTISVTFTPSFAGTDTGNLLISDDALGSPQSVSLTGSGIAPAIQLSTASLTFGNQGLNAPSYAQFVQVDNTGNGPIVITGISVSGSGDFSETNDCPLSPVPLAGTSACLIDVIYTPTVLGAETGTITVSFDGPGSPQTVALSGLGAALNIQPGEVIFGAAQGLGTASAPQTVTVTNAGSGAATISGIQATGEFSQTNNCGSSLNAGASCAISVTFTPTTTGLQTGTVTINSDLPETPDVLVLGGFADVLTLYPESGFMYFGNDSIGTTSAPRTATLINTGATAVSITSIQTTGDFAQTNNCGTSLAAGASCTINVTYSPTSAGYTSQTLTINSNSPDGPRYEALEGTGAVLYPLPNPSDFANGVSLTFNGQLVGTTSAPQTLTLLNSSKSNSVTITGVTASTDYAATTACSSLAPLATCTVSVTFTPSVAGQDNGTLTINDNAADNPVTISLSGFGSGVSLLPSSLAFSESSLNTASATQTVTLKNNGTGALTLAAIGTSGDFAETNNCPVAPATLASGAQCTIDVNFTPTLYGPQTGELVVDSNDPGTPNVVTLQGAGPSTTFADTDLFVGTSTPTVERFNSAGTLLQKLNTDLPGGVTTGMAFDSAGNLYTTDFFPSTVSKFDDTGSLLQTFGINLRGEFESILFDASDNAYIGAADGNAKIRKVNASGNLLGNWIVATENRGTDWIDLAQDQCTVYYTSEGQSIKRYNVCTNTQLSDFTDALPGAAAYALRILPTGGVLVADTDQIVRLDASGNIVQLYRAPGENGWFALNLDPDGISFWSAGYSSPYVYKFNIATGAIEQRINTGISGAGLNFGVSGLLVKGQITAANAIIDATPAVIGFGNEAVGAASSPVTVTVTNTGSTSATISTVTLAGTNPADFALSGDTCTGATLVSAGTCAFNVAFTPQVAGALSAEVEIASSAPGSPQTVALSGTGSTSPAVATLSTTSITFLSVHVGLTCDPQIVTLTNTGAGPMTISALGTSSPEFPETNTCPVGSGTLAPGASCAITVKFAPTSTGSQTGSLTISDNASGSPQTVALTGTGLPACALRAALSTAKVLRGATSATFQVTDPSSTTAPSCFASTIHMSCIEQGALACAFNPVQIPPGGTTRLTVGNVPALTQDNQSFEAIGQASPAAGAQGLRQAGVVLGVAVEDFNTAVYPATATVSPGESAGYSLALVPVNGLTGPVSFTCSGAPMGATCDVSPATVSFDGPNAVEVRVNVATTGGSSGAPLSGPSAPYQGVPPLSLEAFGWLAALLLAAALGWKRRRAVVGWVAVLLITLAWAGCGGGGMNSVNSPTPAGMYSMTVTATYNSPSTAGGTGGTFSHNVAISLKVN